MDPKEFWKSKTFWFNVLSLVVLIANGFGFVNFANDPRLAEYAAAIITIVNVILRLVTSQPLSLTRVKPITFGALKDGAPKR